MEHFELVEKLVNTFGVSYEKAKEALEASNWDAIDAAIYLEKEKKGETQPAPNTEPQAASGEEPKAEEPRAAAEEQQNAAAEETKTEEPQPKVNTGTKGSTYNIPVDEWKRKSSNIFNTILDFITKNSFVVKKNSGEVFLDIPIWLMVLLVCAFFWPVVMIMGIVFVMGYRFSFEGPHLGKKRVKNTMNHVETMTEEFVQKVKNTVAPDNVEPVENADVQPEIKIEPEVEVKQEPEAEVTPETNQNVNPEVKPEAEQENKPEEKDASDAAETAE